jgi:hypothetical protein
MFTTAGNERSLITISALTYFLYVLYYCTIFSHAMAY